MFLLLLETELQISTHHRSWQNSVAMSFLLHRLCRQHVAFSVRLNMPSFDALSVPKENVRRDNERAEGF